PSRDPVPAPAQAVLVQRRIEVRDKQPDESWVLNMDDTLAAQEKAAELAGRFRDWAWEDPARAGKLAAVYNRLFNDVVLRSYDDASLSLPGLALSFEPRPHQIARHTAAPSSPPAARPATGTPSSCPGRRSSGSP